MRAVVILRFPKIELDWIPLQLSRYFHLIGTFPNGANFLPSSLLRKSHDRRRRPINPTARALSVRLPRGRLSAVRV